ncbi:MAG: 2-C-methyl-D-erythritol 4-phosphate cytidylyltransferase [Melioribacteraceae bacterium]|nr:2-C-methyl-D-erythritol 4-phosphate cytidylyltransferase [Melioribacteraceae bacterium]
MKVYAVIPSGGVGSRTSNPLPKQYVKFGGKEIIAYTLEVFQNSKSIDEIIVAAQQEFFGFLDSIKEKYNITKLKDPVEGGQERQYSVINAVRSLNADAEDIIVVHDAVRPLLSSKILDDAIRAAKEFGGSIVALKAKDTLIKGDSEISSYLDRNEVYYVQTPQVFKYEIFIEAVKNAEENKFLGTDESMLVYNSNYPIKIVTGSSFNFKITSDDDMKMFDSIIKGMN